MEFSYHNIGEFISSHMLGCSPFFVNSSILAAITNKANRTLTIENAEADIKYQRLLQNKKEEYEDFKEAQEVAFKLWLKEKKRGYAIMENDKRMENDLQKSELQMFFRDWPLQISIEAINEQRKNANNVILPINIIVGKHFIHNASDPLALKYSRIVDNIKSTLNKFGILEPNIYRFKDNTTLLGGAALACIYSMISKQPSVVILPRIDNRHKQFIISIGIWNQDSLFPIQKEVLHISYDTMRINLDKEYLDAKVNEIQAAYITIAAVLNDTYSIVEGKNTLLFPQFANEYKSYPHLIEFARKEYNSLLNASSQNVNIVEGWESETFCFPYSKTQKQKISQILANVVNELSIL